MSDETQQDENSSQPEDQVSRSRGPMGVDLPADEKILSEARVLVGDRDVRLPQLAALLANDPVLTLELLKVANATFFSADRPPITNIRTAIIRLGSGVLVDTLTQLAERPRFSDPQVSYQFEALRSISTQVAYVSQIIASVAYRDLTELAQTAGLFTYMGHLVVCAYLGEKYVEILTNAKQYASLTYRLQHDYNLDVRSIQLAYLRMRGVPQDLFYALDRNLQCKTSSQANLRFCVQGGTELVEAALAGKWDKYSPLHPLPAKSALRLLKLTNMQYEQIYELTHEFLHEPIEQKRIEHENHEPQEAQEPNPSKKPKVREQTPERNNAPRKETAVADVIQKEATYITRSAEELKEDTETLSEDGQKVLALVNQICAQCKSTQDVLANVMNLLISDGPYARAALILLGKERSSATIHTAVGDGFEGGAFISVPDPLSPLALCLTKINSFNCQGLEDTLSPFGITSYAVSPIRVKNVTPVVLYADCGIDRSLPMEARKIFRLVVGLLNKILPGLPGGLPKRIVQPAPTKTSADTQTPIE